MRPGGSASARVVLLLAKAVKRCASNPAIKELDKLGRVCAGHVGIYITVFLDPKWVF